MIKDESAIQSGPANTAYQTDSSNSSQTPLAKPAFRAALECALRFLMVAVLICSYSETGSIATIATLTFVSIERIN